MVVSCRCTRFRYRYSGILALKDRVRHHRGVLATHHERRASSGRATVSDSLSGGEPLLELVSCATPARQAGTSPFCSP